MKRVLFLITKSENGGAQRWTQDQIKICSDVFECFLATDKDGWLTKNINVKNKLLNELIHKRFSFKYLFILLKFIRENNINLIIASSANAGIYARLIKIFDNSIKVIYVSHGWSAIYNGGILKNFYIFIERVLSKLTNSVLCISKQDYEKAKSIIGISEFKLKLIVNKIFSIQKNNKSTNNKTKTILTVARLIKPKRVDLLIEATRGIDIELHIVGGGIQRKHLESMAHKNVKFHGEIDGLDNFGEYDIFALISDSEGLPISVLEAMSAGKPLILSSVGGCSELIRDNGVLVQNNVNQIKNAILLCLENLNEFSNKSLELFNEKFDLEKNKKEYIDYYKKFLN